MPLMCIRNFTVCLRSCCSTVHVPTVQHGYSQFRIADYTTPEHTINPNPGGYVNRSYCAASIYICSPPPPLGALLLVAWESYKPPSRPEYTKTTPLTGGCYYFLFIKSPNATFL